MKRDYSEKHENYGFIPLIFVKFEKSRNHCVFREVSKGKKGKFNLSHLEERIPSNTWLKVGFEWVEEIFLKDSKPLIKNPWCFLRGRSRYQSRGGGKKVFFNIGRKWIFRMVGRPGRAERKIAHDPSSGGDAHSRYHSIDIDGLKRIGQRPQEYRQESKQK